MPNVTMTQVPGDDPWVKLGASTACTPVPWWLNRFIWIGASKTGKSTILGSMPDGCHADIEGKAHSVVGRVATRIPIGQSVLDEDGSAPKMDVLNAEIRRLDAMMLQLQKDAQKGQRRYRHVIFDSIDKLQELIVAAENNPATDFRDKNDMGKSISRVAEKILSYPRKVYSWGYGWSIVTHSKTEVDEFGVSYERAACWPSVLGGAVNDAEYILIVDRQKSDPKLKKPGDDFVIETKLGKGQKALYPTGGCVPLPERIVCPATRFFETTFIPLYEESAQRLIDAAQ